MRIALDLSLLDHGRPTGRAMSRLYEELSALRPDWEVVGYHRQPVEAMRLPTNVTPRRLGFGQEFIGALTGRLAGVDLVHSNGRPTLAGAAAVVTLDHVRAVDREAAARARAVMCATSALRHQAIWQLGVDPQRVHLTPWAAVEASETVSGRRVRQAMERYRVGRSFVLHFGGRKTTEVLAAWAAARRGLAAHTQLLVVGLDGPSQTALSREAARLGVESSVLLHGWADEADVPLLLTFAEMLVHVGGSSSFPSRVLEAMRLGLMVVSGPGPAVEEIGADAVCFAQDGAEMARAIRRALKRPGARDAWIERGRRRAAAYNWKRCALAYADVFETIASSRGWLRQAA